MGCLTSLMVTMKGLPMTYNRDMQEDKVPLFEAADQVTGSLEMARAAIESVKLLPAKPAAAAEESWVVATDLAEALARAGHAVPPGAPDCGTVRTGKRAQRQETGRLDRRADGAIRARIHGRSGGAARSSARNAIAGNSGRHGAAKRCRGAGSGEGAAGEDAIMTKTYRQGQILKLVRGKKISTQEELAQELKALDIAATQVTLSRDIRDLRLVKTRDGYQEIAPEETGPQFSMLAAEFLKDVLRAQNLVVLKTSPGHANSVAVALDNEEWPEVVGTIAGDDTILVITPDGPTGEAIQEKFLDLIEKG